MRLILLLGLFIATITALELPSTWGSSMVVEADVPNKLWGVDVAGSSIAVSAFGASYNATADSSGAWSVMIAAQGKSTTPVTITVYSSSGGSLSLTDVLVGYTVVCSGQSNMQLTVGATYDYVTETADADTLGTTLRIFQVAMLDSYSGVTTPQLNLTASIPWTRASAASIVPMSALCYYFGAALVKKHPDTPIGLLASSWGGTAIQPWMSPPSLASCGALNPAPTHEELAASPDPSLAMLGRLLLHSRARSGLAAFPTNGSCLYNAMIYPLMQNPKRMLAWYQGESNVGDPVGYQCLMPAMIRDWREKWAAVGSSPSTPFFFVQLSAWPTQDSPYIPIFRVAVENALALPNVGMVVSADLSDPAGALHPIHPMWKKELGRRAALWADNVVFGNASSPTSGPRLVSAVWDWWSPSWANYHFQVPPFSAHLISLKRIGLRRCV